MNILDSLTETQRDQLYDMLLDLPTKEVVEKIAQPEPEGFGIKTHITTLRRFKDRRWAELAADREECAKRLATSTTTTSESIEKLETGIQISIRHHMFERVSAANITDAQLSMVSRWAHRQEKLKLDIQRVQIARERCAQNQLRLQLLSRRSSIQNGRGTFHPCPTSIPRPATPPHTAVPADQNTLEKIQDSSHHDSRSERLPEGNTLVAGLGSQITHDSSLNNPSSPSASSAVKSETSSFIPQPSSLQSGRSLPRGHYINEQGRECDHLGPIARNWEEVGERARKAFGITPEESARRAELRRKHRENQDNGSTPAEPDSRSHSSAAKPFNLLDILKPLTKELQQKTGGTTDSAPHSKLETGNSKPDDHASASLRVLSGEENSSLSTRNSELGPQQFTRGTSVPD